MGLNHSALSRQNARSIQTGSLRLGCVWRLAFGGNLAPISVKPAWSLAFGEVEFVLNLLLPTREAGKAFSVFKRRSDLGLSVGEALAGVGDVTGEIRGCLIEVSIQQSVQLQRGRARAGAE